MNRQCLDCNEVKPLTPDYFPRLSEKHYRNYCLPCFRKRMRRKWHKGPSGRNSKGKRYITDAQATRRALMLMAYSHYTTQSDLMITMLREVYHPAMSWAVKRGLLAVEGSTLVITGAGLRYWVRITEINASRCNYPTYLHKVYNEMNLLDRLSTGAIRANINGTPKSAPSLSDHKSGDNDL